MTFVASRAAAALPSEGASVSALIESSLSALSGSSMLVSARPGVSCAVAPAAAAMAVAMASGEGAGRPTRRGRRSV